MHLVPQCGEALWWSKGWTCLGGKWQFRIVSIHNQPIPEDLSYLRPFLDFLDGLPEEEVSEDVDPTSLEESLVSHLLAHEDPVGKFEADKEALSRWLESFDSVSHPAWWVEGFFNSLPIAQLLNLDGGEYEVPAEASTPAARMSIEPPEGWELQQTGPGAMTLISGDLVVSFMLQSETVQAHMDRSVQNWKVPVGIEMDRVISDFSVGNVAGQKIALTTGGPVVMRTLQYILSISGFHLGVFVAPKLPGSEVDEGPVEEALGTLKVEAK